MPADPELTRREDVARQRISAAYGTPGHELGVTLFVSHHLEELDAAYWTTHTGTATPTPQQVLALLELHAHWDEDEEDEDEDGLDILDFTLPGGVTNYLVAVEFDDSGNVVGIAMES